MRLMSCLREKVCAIVFLGLSCVLVVPSARAQDAPACAVYITGIGCSNCAVTDPLLFLKDTAANPQLMIFEYEIYQSRDANRETKDAYFKNYLPEGGRPGVPFLILDRGRSYIGRFQVAEAAEGLLKDIADVPFPQADGQSLPWDQLDLTALTGHVKIWTKDRVLIGGGVGDNTVLKELLVAEDLAAALKDIRWTRKDPEPVAISRNEIPFANAIAIGDWTLQWNGEAVASVPAKGSDPLRNLYGIGAVLACLVLVLSAFRKRKTAKGQPLKFDLRARGRDCVIAALSIGCLAVFFMLARGVTPDFLEQIGYQMPLPLFTALIAVVDGFNPCNMFVLTCLLALLISSSHSRQRLLIVSMSFVGMVYFFYFLFMAAWLNVFKYVSFITPLRIGIASLAIVAGLINCKELFFFKKGVSLTIPERQRGPLFRRIERMKEVIKTGSLPLLISSSMALAAFASLVELPCTAGFPIIYTGILAGKGMGNGVSYYLYLLLYNFVYVVPLMAIIGIFIFSFRARQITQRQMEIIKFIGGIIMILLGILLLVNPGLLGLAGV